ncbi:hypothetical protein WDZ92_34435, partial [Nostoc sp. NIES-2111]
MSGRRRWIRTLAAVLVTFAVIVPVSAWVALAFWYRLPGPEWLRIVAAVAFAGLGTLAAAALLGRRPLLTALPFLLAFGAVLLWWGTIRPLASADWAPDVSRQTTGRLDGDILTLTDMRDFTWHADGTFDPRWVSRSYDLSKLRTLDVFMS